MLALPLITSAYSMLPDEAVTAMLALLSGVLSTGTRSAVPVAVSCSASPREESSVFISARFDGKVMAPPPWENEPPSHGP
jgi:hypothetical protein